MNYVKYVQVVFSLQLYQNPYNLQTLENQRQTPSASRQVMYREGFSILCERQQLQN